MGKLTSKERELEAVREVVTRLELDAIDLESIDAPDVRLKTKGKVIGVEVTELADPFIASGQAAVDRLSARTNELLKASSEPMLLFLSTGEGFAEMLAGKEQREQHAVALVNLAKTHFREQRPNRKYRNSELVALGAPYILEAQVKTSSAPQVVISFRADGRHAPFVQSCIDKKNALAPGYRKQTPDGLWLLVLAGIDFRSSIWSEVVRDTEFVSAFDRTFYLDAYDSAIFEVRTRPV